MLIDIQVESLNPALLTHKKGKLPKKVSFMQCTNVKKKNQGTWNDL